MRGTLAGGIILLSILLVWLEAAAFAVWGHMNFSQYGDLTWPRAMPAGWPEGPVSVMYCGSKGLKGEQYFSFGSPVPIELSRGFFHLEMRVGWPIQTFQYELKFVKPDVPGTLVKSGLPVPGWVPSVDDARRDRRIPIRPLWTGLFFATSLHAVALTGLVVAVKCVTHRTRQVRGRCPKCGYDRRDAAVCPECGDGAMTSRPA